MVFRFRMLSDENDNFVRDYEVPYDMTLLDFHNFILRSLEYEECMASFFTADERWEKTARVHPHGYGRRLGRGSCGDGERDPGRSSTTTATG